MTTLQRQAIIGISVAALIGGAALSLLTLAEGPLIARDRSPVTHTPSSDIWAQMAAKDARRARRTEAAWFAVIAAAGAGGLAVGVMSRAKNP